MNWLLTKTKNTLRRFDKTRKKAMSSWLPLLLPLIRTQAKGQTPLLSKKEIQRIVIVRNNSRVGNALFLIPFLRQVHREFPEADITLLQKKCWQSALYNGLGINHFVSSQFCVKTSFTFFKRLTSLRKTQFDLCLMPFGSSQDAMICAMLNAKNKVAFSHPHYNKAFTHTFDYQRVYDHAALRCLSLLPQMLHTQVKQSAHQLCFSPSELAVGQRAREAICSKEQLCIAFFRGARGSKRLSDDTWLSIISKMDATTHRQICWVEVMGPDISTPLPIYNHVGFRTCDLRELAAFVKHCDGFISCDTGPLHLADAAEARCIGLYSHTDPKTYGLLSEYGLHIDDIDNFDALNVLSYLENPTPNTALTNPYYGSEQDNKPLSHRGAILA